MKYSSFLKYGIVMGMVGLALVSSACGQKTTTENNMPQPSKLLKVAVDSNAPPFAFLDGKGQSIGFDIDIINHIATQNGYEVQINALPWQSLLSSIEHGESDIAISAISYTTERDGKYLLSNPYVYMPAGIMSLESTHIGSVSDLKPLKLGIKTGTIFENFATENNINQVVSRDKTFLNFQDLVSGKVDAIISDKQMVQHIANGFPEYKVNILEHGDINDKGSYAVALTSKDKAQLINMFNQGITKMKSSGELTRLEKKWFENGKQAQNHQKES